jgi:hypothetical protein
VRDADILWLFKMAASLVVLSLGGSIAEVKTVIFGDFPAFGIRFRTSINALQRANFLKPRGFGRLLARCGRSIVD